MVDPYAAIRGGVQELFAQARLEDWLAKLRRDVSEQVAETPESDVLSSDADSWATQLADGCRVEPLTLLSDQAEMVDVGERQVDVSGDPYRRFMRPGPHLVAGRRVDVIVPYTGTQTLLRCRPQRSYTAGPEAAIGDGELRLEFEWPHDRPHDVKGDLQRFTVAVNEYIAWQADAIAQHNSQVLADARRAIAVRRELLLKTQAQIDALGLPIRRRDDVPTTYAADVIARRPSPTGASTRDPRTRRPPLEPTLAGELYEHILDVTDKWARAMERSPGDYPSWTEENLRDALLIVLNTHYAGKASGETFNKSGKTDVLIRDADRNIFVAECKWWSGAAAFASAIRGHRSALDQLLAYTTWRDAKLALIVFVPTKEMGHVLASAKAALEKHASFQAWNEGGEGLLRCRVALPGDADAGADLAVVFVHLPRQP